MAYEDQWDMPDDLKYFKVVSIDEKDAAVFCTLCDKQEDVIDTLNLEGLVDYAFHHLIDFHLDIVDK